MLGRFPYRIKTICCGVFLLFFSTMNFAQDALDPHSIDLSRMIACGYQAKDYNGWASALFLAPGLKAELGWTEVEQSNSFLKEYRLKNPISVFGYSTQTIAFTNSGVMGVLKDITPQELGAKLGLTVFVEMPGKAMFSKTIIDTSEKNQELGLVFKTKVTLNVSSVTSHPGKTLAGCSYRVDVN